MRLLIVCDDPDEPVALVARNSARAQHPGAEIHVLICDPLAQLPKELGSGEVHRAIDLHFGELRYEEILALQGLEIARYAALLATARELLQSGDDRPLLVVDKSAWFLRNLDYLADAQDPSPISLAPVRVASPSPETVDAAGETVGAAGWIPNFVLFRTGALRLVNWWLDDLLHEIGLPEIHQCISPWSSSSVIGSVQSALLAPSVRFSPRNADCLNLASTDTGFDVQGEPAGLIHMECFDPNAPFWFAPEGGAPRLLVSQSPELRKLLAAYEIECATAGGNPRSTSLLSRLDLAPAERALFQQTRSLLTHDEVLPVPWRPETVEHYLNWLREPPLDSPTGISRAADIVWAKRPDLQSHFSAVRGGDRQGFIRWLWTEGLAEHEIDQAALPDAPRPISTRASFTFTSLEGNGVNLVGYHSGESGLGVAARRLSQALDAQGIPWVPVNLTRTASRQRSAPTTPTGLYGTNLFVVAPDQMPVVVEDIGPGLFEHRYNIGYWFWETDALPPSHRHGISLVDEIWSPTAYLDEIWHTTTSLPTTLIPTPLEFEQVVPTAADRARLGLDDRFTFLFSYDFLSIPKRKNPLGAIKAFRAAFEESDGARLIMKSINAERHRQQFEEIAFAAGGSTDISFSNEYLSSQDRLLLVAAADCYLSLHRSEGLGLTMAEAMANGTPVIATGYSGNLDFMNADSGLLVDFDLVEIGPGSYYPPTGHWAEPDINHAAFLMRQLKSQPELASSLELNGKAMLERFTARAVGIRIAQRLNEIHGR